MLNTVENCQLRYLADFLLYSKHEDPNYCWKNMQEVIYCFLVAGFYNYRTRANKGRADYSKIIFLALRLSYKKHIKSEF